MNKNSFLTRSWNNILASVLGIPLAIYIYLVVSNSTQSEFKSFIGIVIFGVVYWVVIETHATMRFAWLWKKTTGNDLAKDHVNYKFLMITYNAVWWIPIILPFVKVVDYQTGFISFAIITILRLTINFVRNNFMKLEQACNFPFQVP